MKKNILLILLLICTELSIAGCFRQKEKLSIETFNINSQTEPEIKDEIIVAAFIQSIRNTIKEYYIQNLSRTVAVYDYETTILEVDKPGSGLIHIKFGVTPQVGAHNPIGYDEITYSIDSSGNSQLVNYQHIKNYHVNE